MSEGKEGPDLNFRGVTRSVKGFIQSSRRFVKETDLKLDRDAVFAKELFEDVGIRLGFLMNPYNLPKVLEVKSSTREFVSIRRVEATELDRFIKIVEPEDKDPFKTVFTAFISPEMLEEGQILVLDTPETIDLRCKKKEVEQKVLEILGDRINDFIGFTWLAMMSDHPELFRPEDWEPSAMGVVLITKKGGKLFYAHVYGSSGTESGYTVRDFQRLKIGKNNNAEFMISGYFQSATDLEANRNYLKKWGRIYLLTEGSSEKGREKRPLTGFKLVSSFQRV